MPGSVPRSKRRYGPLRCPLKASLQAPLPDAASPKAPEPSLAAGATLLGSATLNLESSPVSFLRSALTYGAIFYLTGLLFLFFGGLYLSGGEEPPGWPAGWSGGASGAAGWMNEVAGASGLSALCLSALCLPASGEHLGGFGGPAPNRPEWRGALLFSVVPFLLVGAAVARRAWASWAETAVALVAVALGLWASGPGGEGLWEALRQISWMWEGLLRGRPPPGWGG